MRQLGIYDASEQTRSPLQTAIRSPRNRPPPRQMRPAEQRAMDPNAGVRRQAMGEIQRRNSADLATMPRTPRGNQFAEAGAMALEATGLPQVRRGAETLGDVAQAPYQPNAPMRTLSGLGELGLGVLGAATFGEVGAMRPRAAPARRPAPVAPPARPPQGASVQSEIRSDGAIELARLSTPFAQRGQGQARQAMNDLIRNADGEGRDIWLRAEPLDKTTDAERLRGFYRGLGFEDAGADGRMVRRAADPSPPLTRPPTDIAPNGMPIRPRQPFRNSLRGGNDDLAEAAAMRAPDVGNAGPARLPRTTIDYAPRYNPTNIPPGPIIRNPSEADLARLTVRPPQNRSPNSQGINDFERLRFVKDDDGNLYVGNAYNFQHDDIVRAATDMGASITESGMIERQAIGDLLRGDGGWSLQTSRNQPQPMSRDWLNGRAPNAPARSNAGGEALNWLGNDRLIRNPTEADLARLAELGDEMKYVMDTDGNVYAFSASDAHHNNAMRALRDNGVTVRPLGPGAEITDPDAAGFIWRNKDGSFTHENANMVESGPYSDFAERVRPKPSAGKFFGRRT